MLVGITICGARARRIFRINWHLQFELLAVLSQRLSGVFFVTTESGVPLPIGTKFPVFPVGENLVHQVPHRTAQNTAAASAMASAASELRLSEVADHHFPGRDAQAPPYDLTVPPYHNHNASILDGFDLVLAFRLCSRCVCVCVCVCVCRESV